MPEELKRKLKIAGRKKGLTGKKLDAYVYGGMRETGWVPSTQKKNNYLKDKA